MRISLKNITELKPNEIFVFGSNESGRHGKGAAKTALNWGAVYGQAEGLQGKTYAIPTKDKYIKTLSISRIKPYVDTFIAFVKKHPDLKFLVTEIGCGLAGIAPKQIAPLFVGCINLDNVFLPARFWKETQTTLTYSNGKGWEYTLQDDGKYHFSKHIIYKNKRYTPGVHYPVIYTKEQAEKYLTPIKYKQ